MPFLTSEKVIVVKIPNVEYARIPDEKITHYLLSETHPKGKHKAVFFKRFGFSKDEWHKLKAALLTHAASWEVKNQVENQDGVKYVIEGEIETPDNRNPPLRAIWIIDADDIYPRFVTAYPVDEE